MRPRNSHKYIIVGASGTGKSTMAEALKELGLQRCITCTTRAPRPGEVEKGEYYFVESFDMFSMFESATFGGNRYGITKDELSRGDFVILEPQGVAFYKENYPGPMTIIKLERSGIDVAPERRARDDGAGFDKVAADITVYGETIDEMKENLIAGIKMYEMRRLRDSGISYLPDNEAHSHICGSAHLWFDDAEFGLPVGAHEQHHSYREPYPGYDGLACFEAADYEKLCVAFCSLTEKGRDCTLDFYVHGDNEQTLYFCRLKNENGGIEGELHPAYLGMDPLRFSANSATQALDLATGGFLAAETDCIGYDHLHSEQFKAVRTYRASISDGRFAVSSESGIVRQPSLDSRIRFAQTISGVKLERLFEPKSKTAVFAER